MQIELPAHIAFSQSLKEPVQFNLSNSCAATMSLAELFADAANEWQRLQNLPLQYASLSGDSALRQDIAEFQQRYHHGHCRLDAEQVLCFAGAQEALAAIYRVLLVPGDEVVLMTPCYPSLKTMAEQQGATVRVLPLSFDHQWQFDTEQLAALLNERTKLIVLNSPHNPTGALLSRQQQQQLRAMAQRHQCYVLLDDVSQASNHSCEPLSHDFLDYDKALQVGVMSKSFGLAGLRLGWVIAGDPALLQRLLAVKSYGSICCSLLDEQIARRAFARADDIMARNNRLLRDNIRLFQQLVQDFPEVLAWWPPQAGMLTTVKIRVDEPIEQWSRRLAARCGVLLLPGSLFFLPGNYVRLGLGQSNFADGVAKLRAFLESNTLISA